MRYRRLGKTGLDVSEIGFGAEWMGGGKTPEEVRAVAEALRAVRVCSTRSLDRTATLWKRSERLREAAMTALHEKYSAMTEAVEVAREDGAVGIRAKISIGRIRIS